MRKGKEFYDAKYKMAMSLAESGLSVKEIAKQLDISDSCAYMWSKGRKPKDGRVTEFISLLEKGPKHEAELPFVKGKHNEVFLLATNRGLPVKRIIMKGFGTWYFLDGQEEQLKMRMNGVIKKIKEI